MEKSALSQAEAEQGLGRLIAAAVMPLEWTKSLERVGLDFNKPNINHAACLGSALRYGCSAHEVSFAKLIHTRHEEVEDLDQFWRWIAFALFYRRSKPCTGEKVFRLRKINLTGWPLTRSSVEAFAKTLRNPAELVYRGTRPLDRVGATLQLVFVSQGARLYARENRISKLILELPETATMEIICEETGWACVLLAGYGLGWIEFAQVENANISDDSSTDNRVIYDLELDPMDASAIGSSRNRRFLREH